MPDNLGRIRPGEIITADFLNRSVMNQVDLRKLHVTHPLVKTYAGGRITIGLADELPLGILPAVLDEPLSGVANHGDGNFPMAAIKMVTVNIASGTPVFTPEESPRSIGLCYLEIPPDVTYPVGGRVLVSKLRGKIIDGRQLYLITAIDCEPE